MTTHIGSVFLGDFTRIRNLSTPPSSPPPMSGGMFTGQPHNISEEMSKSAPGLPPNVEAEEKTRPPVIEPALALELRLRWLEAIILGVKQDALTKGAKGKEKDTVKHGETLFRLTENVQRRLEATVEGNDGLKRFMEHYDQNAHLLTPAFALSGTLPDPPAYDNMSSEELEAFLTEMEPDIRAADRDMREIEALEKKGVTQAGKLGDYEALQPRLQKLLDTHLENIKLSASLEKRIAMLMQRHATYVDALSELFVSWDDTLTEAEDNIARFEREREERRRLGLEP